MKIQDLVREAHQNALQHGWWDDDRSVGECIALMHSELSEALEEYRDGYGVTDVRFEQDKEGNAKPEGLVVELADVVIRIADFCGRHGLDLSNALGVKMEYNKLRPYKHGGKRL